MWSYYGAKTNVVQHYPPPKHGLVIEPFCGTARYALRYFENDVTIMDKYPVIINIWKWLQQCSEADVKSLPDMKAGEHVDQYTWDCPEARDLMGFIISFMPESPRKTATIRMQQKPNIIKYTLNRIAGNLFKIRHWDIRCGSYLELENEPGTWFIDPPYQQGGKYYIHSNKHIDYKQLADWCQARKGQVIVCESAGADWLPFQPLVNHHVRNGLQKEVIWLNEKSVFDNKQLKLF